MICRRLECNEATGAGRVKLAYRLAFGRAPTAGELEVSLDFIRESELENFCHALLNANEFVYVD